MIPIAASVAVLLYIGNLAFFIASPDLAFKKYYKEYTPVYYAQANVNEAQALVVHSFDQYNKGNYEAVSKNMHTLMEEGKLNVRGQIMLALYDAWNLDLREKINPDDTKLEDATWYLALTFYKLGDYEKAQSLFKELSTKDYRRAGKAARRRPQDLCPRRRLLGFLLRNGPRRGLGWRRGVREGRHQDQNGIDP